jgi:hypothetical protein
LIESARILSGAIGWMHRRGWREKLAKSRSGQSLYEHSLIELDVFLRLAPIFRDPRHYGLSKQEENVLVVSFIVHDAGKETDEWQEYVKSPGGVGWVSHILPELSEKLVPQICTAVGFADVSSDVHRVMVNCAGIHHDRPGRSDAAIIGAMLTGATDRFLTLANLVKAIDHLCSAGSPSEAAFAAGADAALQKHISVSAHEVVPRGFSTTLLHRASEHAFGRAGWSPLMYFPTGTVYVADLNAGAQSPAPEAISGDLRLEMDVALGRDVTALIVGNPTGNILPKPDLLSFAEIRRYLVTAGRKIGPLSFAKKKLEDRQKVVAEYLRLTGRTGAPTNAEVARQSGRISVAQPEMVVFKFFKAVMDPDKVREVGQDGALLAQHKYEAVFGSGSWDQLQSTSTLMAAKDMASTVDRYWDLPGHSFGYPNMQKMEELPPEARLDVLVNALSDIATSVFEALGRPSPRDSLSAAMAKNFVADLLTPGQPGDIKAYASAQLSHYRRSKPSAGKELAASVYLCPICSRPFDRRSGRTASADFIDNPQTHTNRGVSHGGFGYVVVCSTCYHERLLRQLLMGRQPKEIIALSPRLNLGPSSGPHLIQAVREWADAANGAKGVGFGFSMSFTDQTASKVGEHDPFALKPEELVELFRYRYTAETQKKRRKEALDLLQEEFDDNLDSLNVACAEPFTGWDTAVEALLADEIDQQECKQIRRKVFRLGDAVTLIPQTPNLVLIPLGDEIAAGKDESESNKGLRRLYVALILSVVFDSAVSIRGSVEIPDFGQNAGAAYVPAIPAIRSLIRKEWIAVSEARYWLAAIGAASVLARDAALPARSAFYQALTADPAEKLVRRIEEKEKGRVVSPLQLKLISELPGFHAGRSEEAHT